MKYGNATTESEFPIFEQRLSRFKLFNRYDGIVRVRVKDLLTFVDGFPLGMLKYVRCELLPSQDAPAIPLVAENVHDGTVVPDCISEFIRYLRIRQHRGDRRHRIPCEKSIIYQTHDLCFFLHNLQLGIFDIVAENISRSLVAIRCRSKQLLILESLFE